MGSVREEKVILLLGAAMEREKAKEGQEKKENAYLGWRRLLLCHN